MKITYERWKENDENKINGLLEDGYLSRNALLNDPRFLALARSGNLRVSRLSGTKESVIKKDEVSGKFYGSGKGAGVSYGDSSPNEFISSLINLKPFQIYVLSVDNLLQQLIIHFREILANICLLYIFLNRQFAKARNYLI